MVGFKHIAAIYFVSAIGGNLFSSAIDSSTSIGASTADFGILFGLLSMIIVNWFEFKGQQLEQVRCMLLFIVIIKHSAYVYLEFWIYILNEGAMMIEGIYNCDDEHDI